MNAQEARIASQNKLSDAATIQYDKIMKQIESAADQGKFQIFTYEALVTGVKYQLVKEGFVVDDTMDRNEICNTISW